MRVGLGVGLRVGVTAEVHADGDAGPAGASACGERVGGIAPEEVGVFEAKIGHGAAVAESHVSVRVEHDHAGARELQSEAERRHTLAATHVEQRDPCAVSRQAELTQHVPHLTYGGPPLRSLLAHRLGAPSKEPASPVVLERPLEPRRRQQRR